MMAHKMIKRGQRVFVGGFGVGGIVDRVIVLPAKCEKPRLTKYHVKFDRKIPYRDSFIREGEFVRGDLKVR